MRSRSARSCARGAIDCSASAWIPATWPISSIEARKILDEAGFPDAVIVASNDLDEYLIDSLSEQGARIDVWGVGTKLVTAYDQTGAGRRVQAGGHP